jgi:DNA-binding NarL/FixJ family response regulator
VLLDLHMPNMNGIQALAAMQEIDPDVCCCFMTGDCGESTVDWLLELGALYVFSKPFHSDKIGWVLMTLVNSKLRLKAANKSWPIAH